MSTVELTVPCVAAHLLAAGELRFLPTDADTECETCLGCSGDWIDAEGESLWLDCPGCDGKQRRPLRAGDRIAIRADGVAPIDGTIIANDWLVVSPPDCPWFGWIEHHASGMPGAPEDIRLRPGEVVGYATVTNVLPIVDDILYAGPCVCSNGRTLWLHTPEGAVDLSDHLAAGLVFTPGQIALELTTA